MFDANWAILACKTKGIAIFWVLTGNDEMSNNWRENIINVVTRDHMVDKNLEDRINKNIEIPFRMTMVFEKIF